MRKSILPALALVCALLTGTAAAAWYPADFDGGSLSGIVADGETFLVSDVYNKIVWRINADGTVERAVGRTGIPGLDGVPVGKYDDGTLDSALFMEPWAMTPFLDGYAVTDTAAHVVRWFDETGVYTAVGSGKAGSRNAVGINASFRSPTGLATGDGGEVYIADTGNGAIRVMSKTGRVTTLLSGLADPTGLCWADGSLYVAETGRSRILRVTGGVAEVVAGIPGEPTGDGEYEGAYVDGPVDIARFDHPQGVAVGNDGTIYVADTGNHAVRKIADGRVTTLAVSRESPLAPIQPRGILVLEDSLLVTDLFAQTLLVIDLAPASCGDVPEGAWYAQAVRDAAERGILLETGGGAFLPEAGVDRASLVVMLSRLHLYTDGSAVINGDAAFSDVADSAFCAAAVRWAADRGIVTGYGDGRFGPEDPITREQLAVLLWRYAGSPESGHDISRFTDAGEISDYACEAIAWASELGIVSGMGDGAFDPGGTATRAQAAQILMNFMERTGR